MTKILTPDKQKIVISFNALRNMYVKAILK